MTVPRKRKEYLTWYLLKRRCTPGQHGSCITQAGQPKLCERWLTFANFLADVGPAPTQEHIMMRLDPAGAFEPGNALWQVRGTEVHHRKKFRLLEHNGRIMSVSQWARQLGMRPLALFWRLQHGWSVQRALDTPPGTPHQQRTRFKTHTVAEMDAAYRRLIANGHTPETAWAAIEQQIGLAHVVPDE